MSSANETPSMKSILDALPSEAIPTFESVNLNHNGEQGDSLRMTIMKKAWDQAGIDRDDPGAVNQYYLDDLDLLVVDLDQDRQRRR